MRRVSVFVLLVGAFGFTTMSGQPPQQWAQWRGPSRNGSAAFDVGSLPDALTKRWEVTVGLGHSSPVVADRRVVIHTREADREVTRAFDLQSGKELWRDDYAAPYTMNPAARAHGPGPKSTPVIAGTRVFTLGITGVLSALDLTSGKLLWRTDAPPAPPEYGTAMSPIVEPPNVIVHIGAQDKGALTAFDVASGKPRWRWTGDGPAYASPITATISGTRQLITQTENFVVGLDVTSGQLLWQIPFRTSYDQNTITPVISDNMLIYSGLESGTTAVRLVQKGASWIATSLWKNEQISMYMSSPVVVGNTLYGLSHRNRGQFFAIDVASGKTLWTTPGREGDNASVLAAPKYLLFSTTEGELIVARPNPRRFEEVKRYRIAESAVWAHPAVSGTVILVKDVDKLICWSV